MRFVVGRRLARGEASASGAYALVDERKGSVLRIALIRDVADLLRSETRYVAEAWLV